MNTIEDRSTTSARRSSRRGGGPFLPRHALAEPQDGPTLVVTHHVPHSAARNPVHGATSLSPAFDSDCSELIAAAARSKVVAWIFGHHHWNHEVEVNGLRLVSAQTGYPGEQTGWNGPGILSI